MMLTDEDIENLPFISEEDLAESMTYEELWAGVLEDFENDADEIDRQKNQN
ncbi:MAG: hypothetical protein MJZ23_02095 [Paludibacteraceae bacterium]|nr:hypothetical protein [Paludibacteraceae bacterium]